ncbi:hypothetical protein [Azotobacter beijerinckii]|uniref:hypothetical protein n=1 Tax=Azotobacter beijerinckii TaxID=170623 RepID=UPI002953AA79|nr:hypothetical protein [Azotobacter beijerinckii]MDV7209956.1 hypothetical protein [Azotobacter beijerinckii]
MTIPITARHTREIDGRPLIEIRATGPRIFLDAELRPQEIDELVRQLKIIANNARQGVLGRRVYPEDAA